MIVHCVIAFFALIPSTVYAQRLFVRTLGGSNYDSGRSLIQTDDGGYRGFSYDLLLSKFDSFGYSCIGQSANLTVMTPMPTIRIQIPEIIGYTPIITAPTPLIRAPLPTITTVCATGIEEKQIANLEFRIAKLKPTPNPFSSFAVIPGYEKGKFLVYDITGKLVGIYKGNRIGENLSAGVYFIRAEGL